MDFRGRTLLSLTGFFGLIAVAQAAGGGAPLRALSWLSPDGAFEALSSEPQRRLHFTMFENPRGSGDDPASVRRRWNNISAGEALFHDPLLLGGQAAKAGISCASCHVNGRGNPHFVFPGVSGDPGTADVTHSFFSSHRGDGAFNPVPIPDLTEDGKVSRDKPGELETFIRGLIVEEFDGAPPGDAALAAVSAYVRALRPVEDEATLDAVTVETHLARAESALAAARSFEGDHSQREFTERLHGSARHQIGLIHERYAGEELSELRAELVAISGNIVMLDFAIGVRSARYYQLHRAVTDRMARLRPKLAAKQHLSLYDPDRLEAALE